MPLPSESGQVVIGDRQITFNMVRVASRKRWALQVCASGDITLRAPGNATLKQADSLLRHHQIWLMQELAKTKEIAKPALAAGSAVAYLGENKILQPQVGVPGRGHIVGDALQLTVASLKEEDLQLALTHWYRQEARRMLLPQLRQWAERLNVRFSRLTIRGQTGRWGSCSSGGGINLNWKLLWLSWPSINYVLVHELCHLRHMNHGKTFWAEVALYIPDYPAIRQELRKTSLKD